MNFTIYSAKEKKTIEGLSPRSISVKSISLTTGDIYAPRFHNVPTIKLVLGEGDHLTVSDLITTIKTDLAIKDKLADIQTMRTVSIHGTKDQDPLEQPFIMELLRTLEVARYKVVVHTNGKHQLRPYTNLRNVVFSVAFSDVGVEQGENNVYQSLPYLRSEDTIIFRLTSEAQYHASMKVLLGITTKANIILHVLSDKKDESSTLYDSISTQMFSQTLFVKLFPKEPLRVRLLKD